MKTSIVFFLIVISFVLYGADPALAASSFTAPSYGLTPVTPESVLDKVNFDFAKLVPHWGNTTYEYANSIFWKLVLLDFTWTTIVWVKDRKEIGELMSGFIGKIMTIGFFYTLLVSAGDWIPAIIESLAKIGQDAAGTGALSPDAVFSKSLSVVSDMYGAMGSLDLTDRIAVSFGVAFAAIVIVLGHAAIAGTLLVTQIETYIAIGGGVILLGFGGSRWTSDMSSSYLKFAVGSGIKLMLCYMVIGAGLSLFTMTFAPVDAAANGIIKTYIIQSIALAGESVLFIYMAFTIPGIASAMMSGSPNMSLGGVAGAAITAGAGIAGAGAVAGSMGGKAGSALGGAASGMAAEAGGAGKALKAGFDQNRSTGMGFGESAMKAPVPGIKSAASMVGAKAVEAGKSLAEGGKGMLGKAGDAINNSAGGKVASNIAASGSAAVPGADTPDQDQAQAETMPTPNYDIPPGVRAAQADKPTSNNPAPGANYDLPPSVRSAQAEKAASMPPSTSSPSSSSAASSGGATSNNSQATSGGDSGASSSPAGNSGGGQGDASGASIGGGSSDPHTQLLESMNKNLEMMANGPEQARKLHQKISSLRDFVPNDGATVQTSGISMGHTRD